MISILTIAQCSPFDDGKYKPKNYDTYDDGKYYRPLDEGKYVPSDEGKYTYIYQRGAYPYDGTYKHLGRGDSNEYIGHQTYAPRFPFLHRIIKTFIAKYVSPDIGGVKLSWTANNVDNVKVPDEVAVKCKVIEPTQPKNITESVTK